MATHVAYRDGGKTTEEGFYKHLARLFTPGVALGYSSTSLQVTQRGAGANMSVDIAIGDCLVTYSSYAMNGWNDAAANAVVSASNPSNPRNDIVVAFINLATVSSATNDNLGALEFKVVAGTPAASPSDPSDPTIQTAVGGTNPWIKLARIVVPAAAGSVVDAYITDLRAAISANAPVTTDKLTAVTYTGTGSSVSITTSDQVIASQVLPTYAAPHKFLIEVTFVYTHNAGANVRDYTGKIKNGTTLLRSAPTTSEANTYVRSMTAHTTFTSSGGETINFTMSRSTDNGGLTVTDTHYTIIDLGRA